VGVRDAAMLVAALGFIGLVGLALYLFFRTNLGTAMRATGDNPQMIRALGVSIDLVIIFGLALSNGLIALAGALLAQYQGFADVQMGIGMVVWGLASVIIGESLVGSHGVGLLITGAVMGSVLFRLMVAIALRWGLNPNDLKTNHGRLRVHCVDCTGAVEKTEAASGGQCLGLLTCSNSTTLSRRLTPALPTKCAL
jgi:putative ABC transport system permease protein